jgi:bacterioferritin-associated ferredoxin
MYLCLCHGITDHQVKQLSADGTRSTAQVYSHFGVRPKCGKCVPYVRDLVKGEAGADSGCGGTCQCG